MAVLKKTLGKALCNTSKVLRENRDKSRRMKVGLDWKLFSRKRKQMLFVCLAVHAFVFLFLIS